MRRGRAPALRVLRRARDRGPPERQADHRHFRVRAAGLDELERRGRENGVPACGGSARTRSPRSSPTPAGVGATLARYGGGRLRARARRSPATSRPPVGPCTTSAGVKRLVPRGGSISVDHERGSTEAGFVISCAGAWSDRLAVAAGAASEPRIVPFRGGYLRLRPERRELDFAPASIRSPIPTFPFLGGHLTRTIDGEVLLGPSALIVGARDAYRLARIRPADLASTLARPEPGASSAASGEPGPLSSGTRSAAARSSPSCGA